MASAIPQASGPKEAMPGAGFALALLLAINLFNYIDRQILSATLPKIRLDAGIFRPDDAWATTKLGALTTAFMVAYMALAPTSFGIRVLTGLTFSGGVLMFSIVNAVIDTDRRAVRAGYGAGTPAQIRAQRSVERQRLGNAQRRERIAKRRARRNGGH